MESDETSTTAAVTSTAVADVNVTTAEGDESEDEGGDYFYQVSAVLRAPSSHAVFVFVWF